MNDTALLLLAAGQSERMGENKLVLELLGRSVLERSLAAAIAAREISEIIIIVSDETRALAERLSRSCAKKPIALVSGGKTRQESVYNGLLAAKGTAFVAIHDAARCLVTPAIIDESIRSARDFGSGVVALAAQDTIKKVRDGFIVKTLERNELVQIQTPQSFSHSLILRAHARAKSDGIVATDDAALVERLGIGPRTVPGSAENIKLTTQNDIGIALGILARREEAHAQPSKPDKPGKTDKPDEPDEPIERGGLRIGLGEDTHRLVNGRSLVLGGVHIPFDKGLLGHSDADALAHAVADALLGAAGLPDIGELFPDTNDHYTGVCSLKLLSRVTSMALEKGLRICGADCVVIAEHPKLAPYKAAMRQNLAESMHVAPACVNVKATTTEGLGKEGRGEAITARAVVLLERL